MEYSYPGELVKGNFWAGTCVKSTSLAKATSKGPVILDISIAANGGVIYKLHTET